jgi:hypothetical protein
MSSNGKQHTRGLVSFHDKNLNGYTGGTNILCLENSIGYSANGTADAFANFPSAPRRSRRPLGSGVA